MEPSPKFLTHRQDNSFIFNHQSGISGCLAWEHPDELEGPLLKRGQLSQSLDSRAIRFGGQSALVAGPRRHLRHQRLQALQRQAVLGEALALLPFGGVRRLGRQHRVSPCPFRFQFLVIEQQRGQGQPQMPLDGVNRGRC